MRIFRSICVPVLLWPLFNKSRLKGPGIDLTPLAYDACCLYDGSAPLWSQSLFEVAFLTFSRYTRDTQPWGVRTSEIHGFWLDPKTLEIPLWLMMLAGFTMTVPLYGVKVFLTSLLIKNSFMSFCTIFLYVILRFWDFSLFSIKVG